MALHPNTQELIDEREETYTDGDGKKSSSGGYDFSSFSPEDRINLLKGVRQSFAPIPTEKRYEDYSRFVEGSIDPIYGDIDEERAQGQSRLQKWGSVLPRVATKVVAEVAKMPGELAGLGMWAAEGFDLEKFEENVNNSWVQAIDDFHQETNDELLPIYKRRVIEQGGLFRQVVSPEFWATEGADGIGFLLSMFAPGFVTKAAKFGSGVSKLGQFSKLIKTERVANKVANVADDFIAGGINTLVESTAEGIEAAKSAENSLRESKFAEFTAMGLEPDEAEMMTQQYLESPGAKRIIGEAGANTVKANMAILLGPNILDQKWLFSKAIGNKIGARAVKNKIGKVIEGIGSESAETITRAGIKEFVESVLTKGLLGVVKEGFWEEGAQFATSKYFQDKAILGEDPGFIESIDGIWDTYRDSMSDIDMQKSIFLGAVLGGGMGAVAGIRGKNLENKILFGDKSGRTGLANLLQKNFVDRFKSLNEMLDDETPYINGKPNIDPAKAGAWANTILNDEKNRTLRQMYEEAGMTDHLELARMIDDFNYMLPFIQQEGGMELLKMHIDQLSNKQADYLKNTLGIADATVANTKKELLDKAEVFSEVYYGTMLNHKLPKLDGTAGNEKMLKEFDAEVLNTKVSNTLMQDMLAKRAKRIEKEIDDVSNKISTLEANERRTTVQDTELKNLQNNLVELNKKKDFADLEYKETKAEYKELQKKENIQEWWNDRVSKTKQKKEDLVRNVIADSVTDEESAKHVEDALNDTDLDEDTKRKLAEDAKNLANENEVNKQNGIAVTQAKIDAVARKMLLNERRPDGAKIPLTAEEQEVFAAADALIFERIQQYKIEDAAKARQEMQEEFNNAVATVDDARRSIEVIEDPSAPEDQRFSAQVYPPILFDENGEILDQDNLIITGRTRQEVLQKVDAHYDDFVKDMARRMGFPVPESWANRAILDTIDINTSDGEINKFESAEGFEDVEIVALQSSVAFRTKITLLQEGMAKDILDENGKVQLEKGSNHSVLIPSFFPDNTAVLIAEIGVNSKEEELFLTLNKDNIDSIPIKLSLEDGTFIGYIHDVEWFKTKVNLRPEDRERLIQETRIMRKNFLVNGKIDTTKKFRLKMVERKAGWLNRSRGPLGKTFTVEEAFRTKDGKHDTKRVKLGTVNKVNVSDSLKNVKWTTNEKGIPMIDMLTGLGAGMVIAAVEGANGLSIPTMLVQTTLEKADKEADYAIKNAFGLLVNAVKDSNVSVAQLINDLSFFIYPQYGNSIDPKPFILNKPFTLFNVDLYDDKRTRNIVLKIQETEDKYGTYKIELTDNKVTITRGSFDRATSKMRFLKEHQVASPEAFFDVLKNSLKNKFFNVHEKALQDSNEGRLSTIKEVDKNYNVVSKQVNYRDFLSAHKVLSTRVHGVELPNGFITYVTQPTLVLDHNSFEEVKKAKSPSSAKKEEKKYNSVEEVLARLTELYRKVKADAKPITLQHAQHMSEEIAKWTNQKDKNEATELIKLVDAHLGALDAGMPQMSPFYNQPAQPDDQKPPFSAQDFDGISHDEIDWSDIDDGDQLRLVSNIDYENTTVSSFSNINNVIHENNVVSSMISSLLIEAGEVDLTNEDTSNKFINNLLHRLRTRRELHRKFSREQATVEDAKKFFVPLSKEKNELFLKNLDNIINNFEKVVDPATGKITFIGYRERINMELASLKFSPDLEDLNENTDESITEEPHIDNRNFKTDPEKSASARVKRALYKIPLKENGKVKISMIGLPIPRDYAETFNTIMEAVVDLPIDEIIPELTSLADNADIKDEIYKQILNVVKQYENVQETNPFMYDFLVVFRKQRAKFKTVVIYSKSPEERIIPLESGERVKKTFPVLPDMRIFDANKAGTAGVVMDKWEQAHMSKIQENGLGTLNTEKGELTINRDKAVELLNRFKMAVYETKSVLLAIPKRVESTVNSSMFQSISDTFGELGIGISPEALKKLYFTYLSKPARLNDLKITSGQNTTENIDKLFFGNYLYLFNHLVTMSQSAPVTVDEDGLKKDLFGEQGKLIRTLARYEAIVNPSVLSSSFRNAAGDVLYGFVNPHYMSNTIAMLKNNPEKFTPDVFSQSSTWLFKLQDGKRVINFDALKELDLFYFDAAKNRNSKKEPVNFEEMNAFEKEQVRVALYHNNRSTTAGMFFTVSPSDKTTFALIMAPKETLAVGDFNEFGLKPDTALMDKLFNLFVQSEINRINSVIKDFRALEEIKGVDEAETLKLQKEAEGRLLSDYTFTYTKEGKRVMGSGAYFFMIPQMNDFFAPEFRRLESKEDAIIELSPKRREEAKAKLAEFINELIALKKIDWTKLGMYDRVDSSYKKDKEKAFGRRVSDALVVDYVVNNMVSYANQFMLITGDPAKFVKIGNWNGKRENWADLIDNSTANLFKRAAKDIAPGYEGKFQDSEREYTVLMVNEPVTQKGKFDPSKEYQSVLERELAAKDKDIKLADAQSWSSLPEHLRILAAVGRVTQQKKKELIAKFEAYMADRSNVDNKFTDAELALILQPLKPVEVGRVWTNSPIPTAIDTYIKSSVFPLIPQLTENLDLDKLMVFMHQNGIDRIVPNTAVKTGFFNSVDIYKNNKIELPEGGDFILSRLHRLRRDFFRIQQDVPYDPDKKKILKGSQAEKLQFADLEEAWTFLLKGKSYKGHELKSKNDAIRTEIYKRHWKEFLKSVNAVEEGNDVQFANFKVIKERIIAEAIERNTFDKNDIMLISQLAKEFGERDIATIPLFLHPAMPKIEPLLNSLIKNNVLVTKFPGKSYIQGSALGFDAMLMGNEQVLYAVTRRQGVVFTSEFKGSLDYRVVKKDGEEYIEAEVLLPWYFGKDLNIQDYIDPETKLLDTSKIDPELLSLIGYRIPTQGHSSMIKLKVVGFLPKSSGDLIIVPPRIVEQMGSDFDVDKLYTHRYNFENKDGVLSKVEFNPEDDLANMSIEQLQNYALNITHSILENTQVSLKVIKPLDNDDVKNVLTDIAKLRKNRKDRSKASQSSLLFEDLHSRFVEINAAGKFGIGVSSISSTAHPLSQYAGLYLKKIPQKDAPPIELAVRFTDKEGNVEFTDTEGLENRVNQTSVKKHNYPDAVSFGLWRMDGIYSIDGVKRVSEVLTNLQTESVDNASNQRLFGMNLNKETFDVALFLAKMRLTEEYIGMFLNQPIIMEYVARVIASSDIGSTEYSTNKGLDIADELLGDFSRDIDVIALDLMKEAIGSDRTVYNDFDKKVLASFLQYKSMSRSFSSLMRALNIDTKFLGKNLDSNVTKISDFQKDVQNQNLFGNVENLINETAPTMQYSAYKYGVEKTMKLYNNLVPYNNKIFTLLRTKLENNSSRDRVNEDMIAELNRGIRTSLWVSAMINSMMDNESLEDKRKSLLFGKNTLAHRIVKARETYENTFLNFITTIISAKDSLPSVIEFAGGGEVNKDFPLKTQQSFLELYRKDPALAKDIMIYILSNGAERNARDLGRFIPIDMLIAEGIIKNVRDVYSDIFVENDSNDNKAQFTNNFLRQFYQHNPFRSFPVDKKSIKHTYMFDSNGNHVTSVVAATKLELIGNDLLEKNGGTLPEFIYVYEKNAPHLYEVSREKGSVENVVVYRKLPLLGDRTTMLTEYDFTQSLKTSMFAGNNIPVSKPVPSGNVPQQKPPVPVTGNALLKKYQFFNNNNKGINRTLKLIASSQTISRGFRELAALFDTHDFSEYKTIIGSNIYIFPSGKTMDGIAGTLFTKRKQLVLNVDLMAPTIGMTAEDFFALVLLHELTHAVTVTKINTVATLSKEEQELVAKLSSSFKEAKTEITKKLASLDPTSKEFYDLRDLFDTYLSRGDTEDKQLKEFVAGIMTDPRLQNVLNSIRTKENITLWDKILTILKELISIINPDIKIDPNGLLASTIQSVIELSNLAKPLTRGQIAPIVEEGVANPEEYTDHSGGAESSDATWHIIGEKFGVKNFRHYREPNATEVDSRELKRKGIKPTNISQADYNEGIEKATEAARQIYGLKYKIKNDYIIRNWAQVKYADAIFAIGTIRQPGEPLSDSPDDNRIALIPAVKGGTGYAVQMAIIEGKPVYVFDPKLNSWFVYDSSVGNFVTTQTPRLTKNYAGIGTRSLPSKEQWDRADKAITDVYEKTFGKKIEQKSPVSSITTSKANIPQNLVSGVESFGTLQEAKPEVKAVLGENPHSIDMIIGGFRTRTTRSADEMNKYNIKVGDIVTHFGKSQDGTTKNVKARITAIHLKGTPEFLSTWDKEGWTQEGIKAIERYKNGAAAIEFEIIKEDEAPILPVQQPPVSEKVVTESSVYREKSGGNFYKFELTDGAVTKGWFSQGRPGNWIEMNPKNAVTKYDVITEINPNNFEVYDPTTEQKPPVNTNGKTVIVPQGANPNNLPIFEDAQNIYLMNDGQQEAYNFLKKKISDALDKNSGINGRISIGALSDLMQFDDPLMANFSGIIPKTMYDNFLGLTGRGGVGKTSVIKKIMEDIVKEKSSKYKSVSIKFIAPTHTAVTVLQESLGVDSEGVGSGGVDTVSSYVRNLPKSKTSIPDPFDPKAEMALISEIEYEASTRFRGRVIDPDIIIIDESSMISSADLIKFITRFKTDIERGGNRRLPIFLFLGDYRQLPPIGDPHAEKAQLGPVSATVLLNSENSYELTQVMRSSSTTLHQMFDAIGNELSGLFASKRKGLAAPRLSFAKYDALTTRSSADILVLKETGIDGVIDDYTTYLIENNNPYGMFWIHYNNISHADTRALFAKIRENYFKKLIAMGKLAAVDMNVPYYRKFRKFDYVEYTGGLEFEANTKLTDEERNNLAPEVIEYLNKHQRENTGIILKPNSRHKIIDIFASKNNLRSMAPGSIRHMVPSVEIDTEKIVTYNRQNKYRFVELPINLKVTSTYNQGTKRMDFVISNIATGAQIGIVSIPYGSLKNDPGISNFFQSLNSDPTTAGSKSLFTQLVPSYIGSSHTAQGNSIKNVIVGDYNIKLNYSRNVAQSDIFSSMYTALTRTSSKLIVIKPNSAQVEDNQEEFTGLTSDSNTQKVKKPEEPKKEIDPENDEKEFELLKISTTFTKVKQDLINDFDMLEEMMEELGVTRESLETASESKLAEIVKRICK